MRGIKPNNIVTRNGDTLEEDWPYFDENDLVNTYNPLYVDAVVSNPPSPAKARSASWRIIGPLSQDCGNEYSVTSEPLNPL